MITYELLHIFDQAGTWPGLRSFPLEGHKESLVLLDVVLILKKLGGVKVKLEIDIVCRIDNLCNDLSFKIKETPLHCLHSLSRLHEIVSLDVQQLVWFESLKG